MATQEALAKEIRLLASYLALGIGVRGSHSPDMLPAVSRATNHHIHKPCSLNSCCNYAHEVRWYFRIEHIQKID